MFQIDIVFMSEAKALYFIQKYIYVLFIMRFRIACQALMREGWNPETVSGLPVAKAIHVHTPPNQELKLGERRWLDTVVVLTINYANKMLARYHWLDPTITLRKLKVFEFWGEYGRKAET